MGIKRAAAWLEASRLNEQGRACAGRGDWDAALSLYQQATDRAPTFEPAWFDMGLVHKRRRQWEQALDCNERAVPSAAPKAILPGGTWA